MGMESSKMLINNLHIIFLGVKMPLFDEKTYNDMQDKERKINAAADNLPEQKKLTECAVGLMGLIKDIYADEKLEKFLFNTGSSIPLYETTVDTKTKDVKVKRTYTLTGLGFCCFTEDNSLFCKEETYRFDRPFGALALALQLARDSNGQLTSSELEEKIKSYVIGKLQSAQ